MNYFVTGIGTDVGKTVVSAILCEALRADYWKPIQTGIELGKDSDAVKSLLTNSSSVIHPESYLFSKPLSPHVASESEIIELKNIQIPQTKNHLIIEGAGGILVPINQTETLLDVIKKVQAEVVLVSRNYLGSINHTLLSVEVLKQHQVPIKGIIFNGEDVCNGEEIIIKKTNLKVLGRIPEIKHLDKETILNLSKTIQF
jgi:dethiobiotin synthetase